MNIKINNKKLLSLLLAGTITLSGCASKTDMNTVSFQELLSIQDVRDNTLMDELMRNHYLIFQDDISYITAADKLIDYMNIVEKLDKVDFEKVVPYDTAFELSPSEVDYLLNVLKEKDKSELGFERKLTAKKELFTYYEYCKNFIHQYGKEISEQIMLISVKANIADCLNIPVDRYSRIVIPAYKNKTNEPKEFMITVGSTNYIVPVSSHEIWNTIQYLYTVQNSSLTEKTEYDTYKKAINLAKITMLSGSKIKNDTVKVLNNKKYIEKHYLSK